MTFFQPTASLRLRSVFYSQLAALLRAAIPIERILGQMVISPPAPPLRAIAKQLRTELDLGATWVQAFRSLPKWAPEFDYALIEAGERSGRLDEIFDTLARHHRERADNVRLMLSQAAYPLLVLHLAIFLVPLPGLVNGGTLLGYLSQTVGVLGVLYGVVAVLVWSSKGTHCEPWRALIERVSLKIPWLGPAQTALALGRLAGALEALVSAGVLVTEAWPLAARASGSPLIVRTLGAWPSELDSGRTPAELVGEATLFPETFVSSYSIGEMTGKLDEQLKWLADHYEEEGFKKLRVFAVVIPTLGYAVVAVWIAYYIFSFFRTYLGLINGLLGP